MNCLAVLMVATSIPASIDISCEKIGNVFTDHDSVRFHIKSASEAALCVTNYEEGKVFEERISAGESKVEIGRLPRDHYTITVRSGNEREEAFFAVVPDIEKRPRLKDSNIASDLATSWLVKPEKFDALGHLAKLSGVIWIRDRIHWREVEAQRGKWVQDTKYDLSADIQIKHGLKVYQVFHNTPDWARGGGTSLSFPDDLRDAYNFAAEMARRFKGKVGAWELWNEPDVISFSDELGDSYAALAKAMYLGFKSADPELPILICSFALAPGKYAETIFQNDMVNYFDIYNYHTYDSWEHHIDRALKHIEITRRYGLDQKPIWLTEAGHAVKRNPDLVEVTPEQGREVADFVPKAIVTSLSAGVDKYFWFVMPYYRERDILLFGLLRDDMTPTAGYCAFSACTYALGKADYIGMLSVSSVHAHVFDRGDDKLAVAFWRDQGENTFRLPVNADKAVLVSTMGAEQELEVSENAVELTARKAVQYVILPAGSLVDTPAKQYLKTATETKPYDPEKLSHVVLRLRFPRESQDKKSETYMLPGDCPIKVSVEIYNFGKSKVSCRLNPQFPEGWKGKLDGEKISVEPMERLVKEFELLASSDASSEPAQIKVNLIGEPGKVDTFALAWVARKPDTILP